MMTAHKIKEVETVKDMGGSIPRIYATLDNE
jgi:hypothetical protein